MNSDTFTHRMGKSKTLEQDPYAIIWDSMAAHVPKSGRPNQTTLDEFAMSPFLD